MMQQGRVHRIQHAVIAFNNRFRIAGQELNEIHVGRIKERHLCIGQPVDARPRRTRLPNSGAEVQTEERNRGLNCVAILQLEDEPASGDVGERGERRRVQILRS